MQILGLKGINRWQVTPHESPNGRYFSVQTRRKLGGAFLGILAHLNLNKSLHCKCRKMYCQTGGILNLRSGLFGPKLISLLYQSQFPIFFFQIPVFLSFFIFPYQRGSKIGILQQFLFSLLYKQQMRRPQNGQNPPKKKLTKEQLSVENTAVMAEKTEEKAVRKKKKRNKKITEVMVEKVMVEKRELVPNANQAGRIQVIEAKYIWLQ